MTKEVFMRHILLALVVLFPISGDAWAWGDEGHKVICEIAMRLVQPNTRAEIQKLMSNDERFTSFSESCTWPDHPRQRASEHFVNLPRDLAGLQPRDLPRRRGVGVHAHHCQPPWERRALKRAER